MPLTKNDLQQIVKILDPKFKIIDKRFDQVDKSFSEFSVEIGNLIAPLATKHELHREISRIDERIDQFEDRFEQFAGNMGDFQSKVVERFNQIDKDHKEHDKLIKLAFDRVGKLSSTDRNHETRITNLETK